VNESTLRTAKKDANEHLNAPRRSAWTVFTQSLLLLFVMAVAALAQTAGQAPNGASAQPLTNALVALNEQYQSAPKEAKAQLLIEMQMLAAKRQQLLLSLMETDPGQVLRYAIPAKMRATFPSQVQGAIEQGQQAGGVLQVLMEDRKDGARLHYGLETAVGHLSLHFTNHAPTHLLSGSQVRVKGVRVGSALALACCTTSSTTSSSLQVVQAAATPGTVGGQNTLVILVNFQDNPTYQPYTLSSVQYTAFTQASNFYLENSDQQASLTGDVTSWFTIGVSSTNCDTGSVKADAQAAAQAAGYNLGNYSHYVYLMSSDSGCGFWGLASIGGSDVWYNGKYGLNLHVFAHEIGHNLGLYHSHSYSCGTAVICSSGTTSEYGDPHDSMAAPYTQGLSTSVHPHFNSFQKERLGWLNAGASPPITTVTASGSYNIGPYENQDSTPKALKILQSSSTGSYYYVEFRQPLGFDSYVSSYSDIVHGVIIHQAAPSNGNSSDLLDMTPTSPTTFLDTALVVGQSFTDSTAGVTITPSAVSSSGATIQVTVGNSGSGGGSGSTCTPANPSVSLSPVQGPSVTAGTAVSFTVTVTDKDSTGCNSANFNLAGSVPSGWSGALGSSMLTLTPGTSGSTTLQVTSPTGTASGFYSVGVSATNAAATSYHGSGAATYVISTSTTLTMSVSTNQSSYSPGQFVYTTVKLLAGSTPDAGASVTVSISSPNTSAVTLSGTTGSNGAVTLKYRLKNQAPAGNYTATASTASSGNAATTGVSTTFYVQ
jgi:hypothetical protein